MEASRNSKKNSSSSKRSFDVFVETKFRRVPPLDSELACSPGMRDRGLFFVSLFPTFLAHAALSRAAPARIPEPLPPCSYAASGIPPPPCMRLLFGGRVRGPENEAKSRSYREPVFSAPCPAFFSRP